MVYQRSNIQIDPSALLTVTSSDGPSPEATVSSWSDPSGHATQARMPRVSSSFENVEAPAREFWAYCDLVPGERYRLRALVSGTADTGDNAAILRFEGAEGGEGLRTDSVDGPYMWLRTGPGVHRTDRLFSVNQPVKRYGLRLWGNRGRSTIKTLTVERLERARPTDFFLTFDVEALTVRAASNHIDRLVWGKLDGKEYGLRRIRDILSQYGLRGIFFLDIASIVRDGDAPARSIVDYLRNRNHEVQMHLHPEELAKQWGFRLTTGFDAFSYDTCRRMLEFSASTFRRLTGEHPRVFRSGGTRLSTELMLAARMLGVDALSNVRDRMVGEVGIGGDPQDVHEPFVWDMGVVEFPIDYSASLNRPFDRYRTTYDQAVNRKQHMPTFNILFHSWSLTAESEQGYREVYVPEYENAFHQICGHVAANGRARTFAEYLSDTKLPFPVVRTSGIRGTTPKSDAALQKVDEFTTGLGLVTCNICDQRFATAVVETGRCPACGSREPQRQLRHVLDNFGNVFDGRSILTWDANQMKMWGFFICAAAVHDFDLVNRPAAWRTVLTVGRPGTGIHRRLKADCVVTMHSMVDRADLALTVDRAAKVLQRGGLLVSTLPYRANHSEGMGPGSGTAVTVQEYEALLSESFRVTSIPGYDSITDASARVFIGQRL